MLSTARLVVRAWALLVFLAPAYAGESVPVPEQARRVCAQGQALWLAGRNEDALRSLSTAAKLAPRWAEPVAYRALVNQRAGYDDRARDDYATVQEMSLGPPPAGLSAAQAELRRQVIRQEAHICLLVNRERKVAGLLPLLPDPALARIARRHSEEMRDLGYLGHDSPTPGNGNVADRYFRAFGVKPRCIAENVSRRWGAACSLGDEKLLDTHRGLMASSGHRANILYATFRGMGIGIAANLAQEYWLTQVFLQPRG